MKIPDWLHHIPSHWEIRKASHILDISVGGTPPTSNPEFFDGDIPWVTIADMNSDEIFGSSHHLSESGLRHANIRWSEPGDLLYSFKLSIGKTAFVKKPVVTNEAIATIHKSSKIYLPFARHVLPLAFEHAAGTNIYGAKILNQQQLKSALIPLPPFEEQKKIADELDRELAEIDEFISDCMQLSVLTEERRLSVINSVIEPLLDKTTAIKHLGSLTSGITLGATYNKPTQIYPYLRVANVQVGRVDLTDVKEVSVPVSVANENLLQKDDVLMTEGGDRDKLGRGAIWSGEVSPMLHQNHVFALRCNKEKLLPEFLVYCLEASYARLYFENNARQSTNLASTNSTIVKNFRVPSICIDKQTKIIELLKSQVRTIESIHMSSNEITKILIERKNSSTHETITTPKPRQ